MRDFTAENTGNRIVINCAKMHEVTALKKALLKEFKNNSLGIKIKGDNEDLLNREVDFTPTIDFIKNVVIGLEMSCDLENALFDCLKYCTYKTAYKIDRELFDEKCIESREDYYEIIIACIEENLKPFMKSLVSAWKTLTPRLGGSQALSTILQTII